MTMTVSRMTVARTFRAIIRSLAFYPVTLTYLLAIAMLAAVLAGRLRLDVAFALFTLTVIAILLTATHREVTRIRALVDAQHDEMLRTINRMSTRIGQLLQALRRADVPVPHDNAGADQ